MNFVALCKQELRVYSTASPATPVTVLASGAVSSEGYARSISGTTALITPEGDVAIYDADFVLQTTLGRRQGVARAVKLSPLGSYAVVFERFNAKQPADNVFVYALTAATASLSTSFQQKSITDRDCLVWTSDERFALRLSVGGRSLDVLPGRNLAATPLFKLAAGEGLAHTHISLAPNDRFVASVVPEQQAGGLPSRVVVFDLQRAAPGGSAAGGAAGGLVHTKTLPFGVDAAAGVALAWARSGLALLITATTSTGSANYYGTTSLHFVRLAADGGAAVAVERRVAESAQCSVWAEGSDEFLALTGEFPCEVGLYDGRTGQMKTSFGKYRRNSLVFQSFSRYFLLLGLGNLPGDFEVFDKNKGLVLASGRLVCPVQVLFAPDGRTWLAATTSPRMRVDNGVTLLNYDGTILHAKVPINDLYHVQFLPAVFPDVPPSPRLVAAVRAPAPAAAPAAEAPRRGGAFAEALRKAKQEEESSQVKKILVPTATTVPGLAAPVLPTKSRNERRRLGKAKAAFDDDPAEWQKPKAHAVKAASAAASSAASARAPAADSDEDDEEAPELDPHKKLRNLNKKLKEVEKLETRPTAELNEAQRLKIAHKQKLQTQIAQLLSSL